MLFLYTAWFPLVEKLALWVERMLPQILWSSTAWMARRPWLQAHCGKQFPNTLLLVSTGFAEVLQEVVVDLAFIWLLQTPNRPCHSFSKHILSSCVSSAACDLFWTAGCVHEHTPVDQTQIHPCPLSRLWALSGRFLEDKNKTQDKSEIPVYTLSASSNQLLRGLWTGACHCAIMLIVPHGPIVSNTSYFFELVTSCRTSSTK